MDDLKCDLSLAVAWTVSAKNALHDSADDFSIKVDQISYIESIKPVPVNNNQ